VTKGCSILLKIQNGFFGPLEINFCIKMNQLSLTCQWLGKAMWSRGMFIENIKPIKLNLTSKLHLWKRWFQVVLEECNEHFFQSYIRTPPRHHLPRATRSPQAVQERRKTIPSRNTNHNHAKGKLDDRNNPNPRKNSNLQT
jgi:hypothetical protein